MTDPDFIQTIYAETANLFEGVEVDSHIRIVHQKTGKAIEVNEYDTRMEDAIIARIRLASALK
ncbi:MAG: hypothetical protein ABF379_10390 [Akkermansiaceae bacterium]|nr:hypothetical protein [Akkermansiaceae bacterium]